MLVWFAFCFPVSERVFPLFYKFGKRLTRNFFTNLDKFLT
ncbi:hypothetical protein LEP1GSC017_2572 [Leptospira meyeri serovar Hardjo str. Went 5]|nr:hypothetical protein LEP1GSC017_2572 [Leptospira meyeri serovar Hardjo str. Went 5]